MGTHGRACSIDRPEGGPCFAGLSTYPLFMQKHWFQPDNAGALRAHIKTIVLELFLAQVSCLVSPATLSACLQAHYTLALSPHRESRQISLVLSAGSCLADCVQKGPSWSLQVPESQKEALADALTFARTEVEEYREDSQVPK